MKIFIFTTVIILIFLCLIFLYKKEKFTNMAGYYTKSSDCDSMTLRDCLDTATCGWCMGDNFAPKCVAGQASDLLKEGKCKKVYANDVWTRAELAGDNDYRESINLPLFE